MNDNILDIAKKFNINGNPIEYKIIESGHINRTYVISCEFGNKYILQYINTTVFKNLDKLMNNITSVIDYSKNNTKDYPIEYIKTVEGKYIYDGNWRMQKFLDNSIAYDQTDDLNIIKEAGKAAGYFQKQVNGFDTSKLVDVIKGFHNTRERVNQLLDAIDNNENIELRKERFIKADECIRFAIDKNRIDKTDSIFEKLKNGKLPLRACHNDTKLGNILFNKDTNKFISLIDLDTIMPGTIIFDYAEGLRSIAFENGEINLDRIKAYTEGFLSEAKDILTIEEYNDLYLGLWLMTYENFIRFLTDYINGDIYFSGHLDIPDYNLNKAINYMENIKSIEKVEESVKEIFED